jgi:PAS domain-containing protein
LRVHQVELELQNRQLREVQSTLEATKARFEDLYDFAPVAYFTFDPKGLVLEANLTATTLVGRDRGLILGRPFPALVGMPDPPTSSIGTGKAKERVGTVPVSASTSRRASSRRMEGASGSRARPAAARRSRSRSRSLHARLLHRSTRTDDFAPRSDRSRYDDGVVCRWRLEMMSATPPKSPPRTAPRERVEARELVASPTRIVSRQGRSDWYVS